MWNRDAIGYCSNVHPGTSLEQIGANLNQYVSKVRQKRGLKQQGAGLWLTAELVHQLLDNESLLTEWKRQIAEAGISLTTLNGFPQNDFHQPVVKEKVYQPDWSSSERLEYTWKLVELLLHTGEAGVNSISTLPLGFRTDWSEAKMALALEHLSELAWRLNNLAQFTGKHVIVCLEMEPGCVLERAGELTDFFKQLCLHAETRGVSSSIVKRFIGCCYDVCHQSVMREDIHASLSSITQAGICIGKIQLSNAIRLIHPGSDAAQKAIAPFVEPKFLHQTTVDEAGEILFLDLDRAVSALGHPHRDSREWRIHYHVPVHREELGETSLKTTQQALLDTFDFLQQHSDISPHLEVETYTWNNLPGQRLGSESLIQGLVNELEWVENELDKRGLLSHE
ncbi:MAG: hypothetical protein CMF25_00020 [Kangiellaceae bacterium]|jgi:hypothetical protein|nr:hypothetical protein [Kangiellaceae bacterium]